MYSFPGAAVTHYHKLGGGGGSSNITEIYSLAVQGARPWKPRCWQARLPLETLGENPSFPLPAPGNCLHSLTSLAYGHITPISGSIFTWPSPLLCASPLLSLTRIFVMGFRARSDNPGWSDHKNLNLITFADLYLFTNKVTFAGSRELDMDVYFGWPLFISPYKGIGGSSGMSPQPHPFSVYPG